jgi:long-chain acyl-CoA synthetase
MGAQGELVISGFHRTCKNYPDNTAIIYLGERFSYKRLQELIDRFATALYDLGVRTNDKVMLYIPNCPQFLIGYFGVQQIGAVPVPICPIYAPNQIKYLINDSEAETVLCQDTNLRYIKEVFPETCLKRAVVTNYVDLLPLHKRVFGVLFDKVPSGMIEKGSNTYTFKDLVRKYPAEPPQLNINSKDHLSHILYTGGTTGSPKACITTHTAMVSLVNEIRDVSEGSISDGKEVLVMVNPLFHQMTLSIILGMVLTKGNTVALMPLPHVEPILKAVERHRATLFVCTPSLYRAILETEGLDLFDLSSLKFCWSGGDVLPLGVFNRWKNRFHVPLYQIYGSTEMDFVSMCPLDRSPAPGSIGFPLPSKKIQIVNPETLEELSPGTSGELLVTSEYMSHSYWKKPDETAASYVEIKGKTWYRTKDYVRMDSDGQLYYVDRSADIIRYRGHKVSCSEIEAALQDHQAVIGACVVGLPDAELGERIKAIVVLKEGVRGVSGAELIKWCEERLASHKVPQYIEFRDMLLKSKVGKLLRREIRDEERRKIGR